LSIGPPFTFSFASLSDGRVVAGVGNQVKIFINDGTLQPTPTTIGNHNGQINALIVLPGDFIVSGSSDNIIKVWTPNNNGIYSNTQTMNHDGPVNALISLSNGDVVSGGGGGFIIWNGATNDRKFVKGDLGTVIALEKLTNGNIVVLIDGGSIFIFNNDEQVKQFNGPFTALRALPNNYLVTGNADGVIGIWNMKTFENVQNHPQAFGFLSLPIEFLAVQSTKDNTILALNNQQIYVWKQQPL
jgi:WD40 repeat protein